jgi:hypothetical protein
MVSHKSAGVSLTGAELPAGGVPRAVQGYSSDRFSLVLIGTESGIIGATVFIIDDFYFAIQFVIIFPV